MMRKATETLRRQWELLKAIPSHPRWQTTRQLHQHVRDEGFEVSIRTIQRDLDFLSAPFPLLSEARGKTLCWQWMQGAEGLEIPAMSQSTALVFQLADHYLRQLIPSSVLGLLAPYLERASTALANTNLASWNDRVIHLEQGPQLIPPEVDEDIQNTVYKALLEGRRLEVEYVPRYEIKPSTYPVSPLGIVLRDGVLYVVCTIWDYTDTRQLAVHRMKAVRLLDEKVSTSDEFSLQKYIQEESAFSYPDSPRAIELKARFDEGAAFHLTERKLSEDQVMKKTADGYYRLTATVKDTLELRWWLLGFGDGVEVVAPKVLRKEFKCIAKAMAKVYS